MRLLAPLVAAVLLLSSQSSAIAQEGDATGAAQLSGMEVKVELERFGVGNMARRGEWCGIRVRIMDSATKQRELVVRLAGYDPDGDTPVYQREVSANPGVWQGIWLYCRLPFNDKAAPLVVSAYEAVEGTTDAGVAGYRAGRLVGRLQLNPLGSSVLPKTDGLIGMMGSRYLGLRNYALRPNGEAWHPMNHEVWEIATGINPADLPDRWLGLVPFEALVWGQGEISELRPDRASAVREWVQRGGHLVVVLPPVGQTWTNPTSNELHDIMPVVSVARQENADLRPYQQLLMPRNDAMFPKSGVVHTFRRSSEAKPEEAMEILSGPDGKCVVVRRLVGAGMVTLVGLDLNQTAFSQFDMITPEVFWHRIFGRRGTVTLPTQNDPSARQQMILSRRAWYVDGDIPEMIKESGQAAAGVLAGFAVFVCYWLIAGPLGYAALKRRGWSRHAWVAFVGAAGIFTAMAWGGARLLRPQKLEAKHVSIVDHVFGQPVQRARTWASVLIPWYGTATISVGDGSESDATTNS